MKATNLPWSIDKYGSVIDSEGRDTVIAQGFALTSRKTAVNNTAFIVRAVNSHDMLVAALELAHKGLNQVGKQDSFIDYDFNDRAIKSVKAALAAVETQNNTGEE